MADSRDIAREIRDVVTKDSGAKVTGQTLMDDVNKILQDKYKLNTPAGQQQLQDVISFLEVSSPSTVNNLELAGFGEGYGGTHQSTVDSTMQVDNAGAYENIRDHNGNTAYYDFRKVTSIAEGHDGASAAEMLVAKGLIDLQSGVFGIDDRAHGGGNGLQVRHWLDADSHGITVGDINTYFGGKAIDQDSIGDSQNIATQFNLRLATARPQMENVLALVEGSATLQSPALNDMRNNKPVTLDAINKDLSTITSGNEHDALVFLQQKYTQQGNPLQWTWDNTPTLKAQGDFPGVTRRLLDSYATYLGTDSVTAIQHANYLKTHSDQVNTPLNPALGFTSDFSTAIEDTLRGNATLQAKLTNGGDTITANNVHAVLGDTLYSSTLSVSDRNNLRAMAAILDASPTNTESLSALMSAANAGTSDALSNHQAQVTMDVTGIMSQLSAYPDLFHSGSNPPSIYLSDLNARTDANTNNTVIKLKQYFNDISTASDGSSITLADIQKFAAKVSANTTLPVMSNPLPGTTEVYSGTTPLLPQERQQLAAELSSENSSSLLMQYLAAGGKISAANISAADALVNSFYAAHQTPPFQPQELQMLDTLNKSFSTISQGDISVPDLIAKLSTPDSAPLPAATTPTTYNFTGNSQQPDQAQLKQLLALEPQNSAFMNLLAPGGNITADSIKSMDRLLAAEDAVNQDPYTQVEKQILDTLNKGFDYLSPGGAPLAVTDLYNKVTASAPLQPNAGSYEPKCGKQYSWGSTVDGKVWQLGDVALESAQATWSSSHTADQPFPKDPEQVRQLRLTAEGAILKKALRNRQQGAGGRPTVLTTVDTTAFDTSIDQFVASAIANHYEFGRYVGSSKVDIYNLLTGPTDIV